MSTPPTTTSHSKGQDPGGADRSAGSDAPDSAPGAGAAASDAGPAAGAAPGEERRVTDRRRPVRIRSPHNETFLEAAGDFARRVWNKADQDQIFFMAGAIAFNVLVAIIPLLLATLGIAGIVLQRTVAHPEELLARYLLGALPPVSQEFERTASEMLSDLLGKASGFTTIGIVLLIWLSTRLVGTLRAALREVFDVGQDRSIVRGKLFDMKMVIAAGSLFTINVFLTLTARLVTDYSIGYLGLRKLGIFETIFFSTVSVVSAWVMFLLIYRYLPYRRINWRTSLYAASFTTVLFELLKQAFAWYVSNYARYDSTYGNFANVIIIVLWVYYMAIIFILGGEVGQVAAMRKIRRQQKERLV